MIEFGLVLVEGVFKPGLNGPKPAGHLAWQWDHVKSGRMRIITPSEELEVGPGESVISPPWTEHMFYWHKRSVSTSIHFHWPEAPVIDQGRLLKIGGTELDAGLLGRFFRHVRFSVEAERRNAAYCFHLMLEELLKRRFPETDRPETLAERVRRLLEENNFLALGVEDAAAKLHMSVNNFIRRFRAETGKTPARHLLECRIARAGELLRFGNLTVKAVALSLGFPDLYTFSHAFRRVTGASPRAWLENFRKR